MTYTPPTTDEMDHTTPEERNALVAFCDNDQEWWKFTRVEGERPSCPICGGKPSAMVGFQIISQRTFNPLLHGKKKSKKRLR